MKKLNNYIIEKLHLNRDTKIEADADILETLLYLANTNNEDVRICFTNWIYTNKVKLIEIYTAKNAFVKSAEYLDKLPNNLRLKVKLLTTSELTKAFHDYVGDDCLDEKFDDITISQNSKSSGKVGLLIENEGHYSYIVRKMKTINDN